VSETAARPLLRHLNSINDLSNDEIESVFRLADRYLAELGDPRIPHRIARAGSAASGSILATLFFEPSTRTRLSFETAMLRLGGTTITSADPATSSAAKGESLADTIRVVSNYADIIALRHPRDGAARLAAEYASIPVINGGDGSHEHPTQTLCDLFTLRRENKQLRGLNVAISGDLKGSRTIHSFVYALARFGANIMLMPAKGMGLPEHVDWRLRQEYGCTPLPRAAYERKHGSIDALYVTPQKPHQLSFIPNTDIDLSVEAKIRRQIDAVYVTRFQKERWTEKAADYPRVDLKFLKDERYADTSVLHPLPRVGELDISIDADPRAVYFKQAAYGVPVRMALAALLLGRDGALARHPGGFAPAGGPPPYDQPTDVGIRCANSNCIVHDPMERPYTRNRFAIIRQPSLRLRCFYCDNDIAGFVAASRRTRRLTPTITTADRLEDLDPSDLVLFASDAEAEAAGYAPRHPRRSRPGA
jgi:aspartate carbamoyltransferase catalytic subunit